MKILIYNGKLQPTTFIQNLVTQLNINNQVIVSGFGEAVFSYRKEEILFFSLGSNHVKWQLILRTIILLWKSFQTNALFTISQLGCVIQSPLNRSSLSAMNLALAIEILKPDVIHIQWASHLSLFKPFLDNKTNQKPRIVVSLRGRLVNVSPHVELEIARLYRAYFPKVDAFHAVSQAIAQEAQHWGAPAGKMGVIYSGINAEEIFQYRKTSWQLSAPIQVLSVGRHHWIKGYHYALDALQQLVNNDLDIHYTIIASTAPEDILYQIRDLGLESHVRIVANLPQQEVFLHMQQSDLLLLPSVEEGIANVVLEAMAIGLPVISSNCGGMAEVIEDRVNGFLFENRDIEHMAARVEEMIRLSSQERERMAAAARMTIERQHTVEGMGREMMELYESVLTPRTAG